MAAKKHPSLRPLHNQHKRTTNRRKVILRQLMQGMKRDKIVKFHGISDGIFNSDVERITMNRNLTPYARRKIAKGAYPIQTGKYNRPYKRVEAQTVAEFMHKPKKVKLEEIERLKKRLLRTTSERRGNIIQAKIKGILKTI